MKEKIIWTRIVFIIGVMAFFIGTLDPMEGSVVIAGGSFLMALSAYFKHDRHWKTFIALFITIAVGVFFLFYLSTFGGFGKGALSCWWGILVIPYPIAWLTTIVLLIVRALKITKPAAEA
jgi:hypothetical protein